MWKIMKMKMFQSISMIFQNIKEKRWKQFIFIYFKFFFYEMVNIFWW